MITMYAPNAAGVYGISNSREWIFVGLTGNIQGALLGHMQNSADSLMQYQPTGFVFELCGNSNISNRRDVLVREYGPRHNSSSNR